MTDTRTAVIENVSDDSETEIGPDKTWDVGRIKVTRLTWGRTCNYCGIKLLTGELRGFCCGKAGKHLSQVRSLPRQCEELEWLYSQPGISKLLRKLNLLFSFAAMETTGTFSRPSGPNGFLAIEGKIYHRLRPEKCGMGLRWVLYDGYEKSTVSKTSRSLPQVWINVVKQVLMRENPFARRFLSLRAELAPDGVPDHVIHLSANGAVGEVAAIMRYENTAVGTVDPRTIAVCVGRDHKAQIPTVSKLWEPLVYPLFFEKGTLGWGVINNIDDLTMEEAVDDSDVQSTQMWYYRIMLLREKRFHVFGRLTNEYIVDMWTRELETRLYYFKMNAERRLLQDAELMNVNFDNSENENFAKENIYLPANFAGSILWASENVGVTIIDVVGIRHNFQVSDALALAARFGCPTFFVTVMCNPEWPEITSVLYPGQAFHDHPLNVARVFRQKLKEIQNAMVVMFPNAGKVLYKMHVIEFQKRGLPHAHILIKFSRDCVLPYDIDKVVSAEMPTDELDILLVTKFMMHSHKDPDADGRLNSCQKMTSAGRSKCRFHYPHALQNVTTIDFEGRVHYRRRKDGDQWVVPHNLELLRKFNCHINFEVANTSHMFSYLFKYVHKQNDRATFSIRSDNDDDTSFNEIEQYWTGRYLSAGEAAWRILGFHITRKEPSVESLPVHLPTSTRHHQYFRKNSNVSVLSVLDRYFLRPHGTFRDRMGVTRRFADLRYDEYYTLFRMLKYNVSHCGAEHYYEEKVPQNGQICQMCFLRTIEHPHVTRLKGVRSSQGEVFYLRAILAVRPGLSFHDLMIFNGVVYNSYQEAAHAMGLFANATECIVAFQEAIVMLKTPAQLRYLFAHMLVNECIETPIQFWEQFKAQLSFDYFLKAKGNTMVAETHCLENLNNYLGQYGRDVNYFGITFLRTSEGEVFHEIAKWYPFLDILVEEAAGAKACMTREQLRVFRDVISAVNEKRSLSLFLNGKAGTGKTHVIRAICSHFRSLQKIVIATASSAFAAQLYDGGRTTHSAFKVPVDALNQMLESEIKIPSQRANFIKLCCLIIWDEAPMANRAVLECVDNILRRIMQCDMPFGGKVIILSGDFRQTCPVVPHGRREDIVEASIRSSHLWSHLSIYRLTVPIRQAEDDEFRTYLDTVGDDATETVPIKFLHTCHTKNSLIDFVFPQDVLDHPLLCVSRSILCPTNVQVDSYNAEILKRVDGVSRQYLSGDSIKEASDIGIVVPDGYIDYHRQHTPPGLPPHNLILKINGVYRLMRNLSVDKGLVKNCRVIVKALGTSVISVQIMTKDGPLDDDVLLPRINFTYKIPGSGFTLLRKQFPLAPAYCTTFNSCQGLTLDKVGIDTTRPVFSHGQLYTALSRIRRRQDGMLRIKRGAIEIENVTFAELLNI